MKKMRTVAAIFVGIGGVLIGAAALCAETFYSWQHWPKPKGTPGMVTAVVILGLDAILILTLAAIFLILAPGYKDAA